MDAEDIRASITKAIDLAERVQATAEAYRQAYEQLQSALLLLDLESSSRKATSIHRTARRIGKEMAVDAELIGEVKTDLQNWLPYV